MIKEQQIKGLCQRYADCQHCIFGRNVFVDKPPYRVFYRGSTNARVVLVGEGPGADEIKTGKPFVGRAGKQLGRILDFAGIPDWDILIANSFVCSDDGYKKPTYEVLKACNGRLFETIEIVRPKLVIALGMYAVRACLDLDAKPPMKQYLEQTFTLSFADGEDFSMVAEYHPAYLLRNPDAKQAAAPRWTHIGEIYNSLIEQK